MIKRKRILLMVASLAALAFITSSLMGLFSDTVEIQRYTVLESHGNIEIRHYPEAVLATFRSAGSDYSSVANGSFRRLANYIFGGNQRGESIAMTAPVHMQMGDKGSEMAFVMPASYTMESLPRPNDPSVTLVKSSEETVASIRFGGWASDEKLADEAAQLATWLSERGIRITGPWRYLGYNAPWKVMGRRNEVIFPIEFPR